MIYYLCCFCMSTEIVKKGLWPNLGQWSTSSVVAVCVTQ